MIKNDISFYRFCDTTNHSNMRIMQDKYTKTVNNKYKVTVIKLKPYNW